MHPAPAATLAPSPLQTPTIIQQSESSGYCYLGVFLPNTPSYDPCPHFVQLISSFFEKLKPIPLTPSEVIHLQDIRLIPAVLYKLAVDSLPWVQITKLQALLWRSLARAAGIPLFISPKDRYIPSKLGGLIVRSVQHTFATQTINHAQGYLHLNSSPRHSSSIRAQLSSNSPAPSSTT